MCIKCIKKNISGLLDIRQELEKFEIYVDPKELRIEKIQFVTDSIMEGLSLSLMGEEALFCVISVLNQLIDSDLEVMEKIEIAHINGEKIPNHD